MQRYEKYKNSGVEWIGEIPEHWEICKLKFLGNIYAGINGKKGDDFSKEYSEGIKSFIPFTNICNNIKIDETKYQFVKIDEKENQNRVQKNDILFLMSSETLDDIAKNSIYLGDDDELYLNSFCKGFRISDSNVFPEFINYLFLSGSYRSYFSLVGRGFTRINLKQEFINDVYTLLPSYSEQQTIANFLDEKTVKIDQTIAIKQKEIELLKERRQILIQKAVTKGLDDTVKLKDSGVDWIGEIPEHWEVRKLKSLSKKIVDGTHFTPYYVDDGIPFLRVTDLTKMQNGKIQWENTKRIGRLEHEQLIRRAFAEKGDVLLSKNGTIGLTKVVDWDEEFSIFVSLCLIKLRVEISPYYFTYFFNSPIVEEQLNFGSSRTSVTNLHLEKIKELIVILPPQAEQNKIIEKIDEFSLPIDKAILLKQQEIEKLKEYKTVLIDQVVTGKVRVS